MSNVKLQTKIPNSNIVIDYWDVKESDGHDPSIRFMTSINHLSVRTVDQMRKAKYRIYTSLFNKWYLHHFYKISEDRIVVLDHKETMEIFDSDRNEKIRVTAIEANYCSGSSMFFFQGSFGNVLYTGFFRLSSSGQILSCPELKEVVEQNNLHVAYVDNSYAAEHCTFPPRIEMIRNIINLIRSSSNCKIVISSKSWGKEEVLLAIASELDEKIDVGPQRYSIFQQIGVVEFFTCQSNETRICAMDHLLTYKECQNMMRKDKSCIIILMTALYKYGPMKFPSKSKYPRLFIIPYSGHCNHNELKEFVRTIQPHTILPVLLSKAKQSCSIIPKSIYDICGKDDERSSRIRKRDAAKNIEKSDPSVVIPKLQVSPLRLKRVNGSYCSTPGTPSAERRSSRSPVVPRACDCVSETALSKSPSAVSSVTVDVPIPLRSQMRRSLTSFTPAPEEQSPEKSSSSSTNSSLLPVDVTAGETDKSSKKSVSASTIQSTVRPIISGDPPALSSPKSCSRLRSASVSATEEKRKTRRSTSKKSSPLLVEVQSDVTESVKPLNSNIACSSDEHPTGDENEQGFIYSTDALVFGGAPNLNDVVTPRRETEFEDIFNENETRETSTSEFYSTNAYEVERDVDLSEAVTPPLCEIKRQERLGRRQTNAKNMSTLEDPNRTTTSSPNNCFIREESRPVLLDAASPLVSQNEENVADKMPLTLRLQNADLCAIQEECRNVLLGPTFPGISQKEVHQEVPSAPSLVDEVELCENYIIEDYIIEESMPSTGEICSDGEANLPSQQLNDEAMAVDSTDDCMEIVATGETASMRRAVSDSSALKSTTANELSRSSSHVETSLQTAKRMLNTAIASESSYNRLVNCAEKDVSVSATVSTNQRSSICDFRPVRGKRSRSQDDVTLFELDERGFGRANVTDSASKSITTVARGRQSEGNEESCVWSKSSHRVGNSSQSLARASPDGQRRGGVDADQSDSDDCVVVGEYMLGMETPDHLSFDRASKRLRRMDRICRSKRNDRFVNAILYHYMKSRPDEISGLGLSLNQWNFLSECNILSHPAYKSV